MQFKHVLFKSQLYKQIRHGELIYLSRGARSFYGQGQNNGKIWKYKWVPQYQIQMLQSGVYAFLLLFLDSSLLKKLSGLQLSVPTAKAMDASCEFSLSPPPSEQEMCMLYVD